MLEVKQVVRSAVEFVNQIYEGEGIAALRLEEVERAEQGDRWYVTLSFVRPPPHVVVSALLGDGPRDYKTLTIDGANGAVESMKIRELESSRAQ